MSALIPATLATAAESRFGRWSAAGYLEGYAVAPVNDDTQRQRPAGIFDLNLTGDVQRHTRLFLDLRGIAGGPPEHAGGLGVFNLSDTFQDISPSLEVEEGYADLHLARLDLRIGKQKIDWGRLDTFHPTDVMTPRRYGDPFILSESDAKIGVPALRATYALPDVLASITDSSLTGAWVPVQVPPRFPTQDERWFPTAASVPPVLSLPASSLEAGLPAITVHNTLATQNRHPPLRLNNGAIGLRVAATSARVDWSLCFYEGPETAPSFAFNTVVLAPQVRQLIDAGTAPKVSDLQQLQANATLLPRFGHIRLFGGDAAVALGGFTVRGEVAYGSNRLLPRTTADLLSVDSIRNAVRPQLGSVIAQLLQGQAVPIHLGDLFVQRDAVEWGIGVDYSYRGWTPVLQVNQMLILHNSTNLLINDVDTRLLVAMRKSFFAQRLGTELVAFQGLERSYTAGILRLRYAFSDALSLRAGYLLLAGSRHTVVGQYHDNDEVFVQLRYER